MPTSIFYGRTGSTEILDPLVATLRAFRAAAASESRASGKIAIHKRRLMRVKSGHAICAVKGGDIHLRPRWRGDRIVTRSRRRIRGARHTARAGAARNRARSLIATRRLRITS